MNEGAGPGGGATGYRKEGESEAFVEFGRAMVLGREEIERTSLNLLLAAPDDLV